jgi:Outer membrane protein beta-barrel domain
MKRSSIDFFAMGAFALAFSQVCAAGDWQLRVGPVVENFRHTEPSVNVKEDGTLAGVSLRLARRIGQWEVEGALEGVQGKNDYNGVNSAGTRETKNSDASITQASVRVGRWFLANDRVSLYGGLGYFRWDRDIQTTTSLGPSLDYDWPYVMAGAKLRLHESERVSVMVDVRVTKPINPQADYKVAQVYAPVSLDLGSELGFHIELPVSYHFSESNSIEFVPFYERIKIGESKTKPLFLPNGSPSCFTDPNTKQLLCENIKEPDSRAESYGLAVHWLRSF